MPILVSLSGVGVEPQAQARRFARGFCRRACGRARETGRCLQDEASGGGGPATWEVGDDFRLGTETTTVLAIWGPGRLCHVHTEQVMPGLHLRLRGDVGPGTAEGRTATWLQASTGPKL